MGMLLRRRKRVAEENPKVNGKPIKKVQKANEANNRGQNNGNSLFINRG